MPINQSDLAQFTGTEQYHRWSPLFRRTVLSDGAKYVAENGGAYWLMDAIASHQPKAQKNENLRDFQLWTLTVNKDKSAVLTCQEDSDKKPVITQKIPYTDFELPSIQFYCNPAGDGIYVIFLRSEY